MLECPINKTAHHLESNMPAGGVKAILERLKERDKSSFVRLPDGSVPTKTALSKSPPKEKGPDEVASSPSTPAGATAGACGVKALAAALQSGKPPDSGPSATRSLGESLEWDKVTVHERRQLHESIRAGRPSRKGTSTPAHGEILDASMLSQEATPSRRESWIPDTDDGINLFFFDMPAQARSDYERRLAGISGVTSGKERDALLMNLGQGADESRQYFDPNLDSSHFLFVGATAANHLKSTAPEDVRTAAPAVAGDLTYGNADAFERRLAGMSGMIDAKERDALLNALHEHATAVRVGGESARASRMRGPGQGRGGADCKSVGGDASASGSFAPGSAHRPTDNPSTSTSFRYLGETLPGIRPKHVALVDGIYRVCDAHTPRRDLAYVPRSQSRNPSSSYGTHTLHASSNAYYYKCRPYDGSIYSNSGRSTSLFEAGCRFNAPPHVEASLARPLSLADTPEMPNSFGTDALANVPEFDEAWVTTALDPVKLHKHTSVAPLLIN